MSNVDCLWTKNVLLDAVSKVLHPHKVTHDQTKTLNRVVALMCHASPNILSADMDTMPLKATG